MILGKTQPFASPGEALEHHGVKGMRWGHRKQEDAGDDRTSKAIADENDHLKTEMSKKLGEPFSAKAEPKDKPSVAKKTTKHRRLTPKQKKVLLALGVTAGVAGFIAYKHYSKSPFINEVDLGPLHPHDVGFGSRNKLAIGEFGKLNRQFGILHPEKLHVDVSKGYADVRPIGGFANAEVARRHAEMLASLDEMRAKYPALHDMDIEVLPMSHVNGAQNVTAYVRSVTAGAAQLVYNDKLGKFSNPEAMEALTPGIGKPGNIAAHEMGHMLAAAGNLLPSRFDAQAHRTILQDIEFDRHFAEEASRRHKALFDKHGISFSELSKLSNYASSEPSEALAELSRYFHIPENRKYLDPALLDKATALFNDLGGVN